MTGSLVLCDRVIWYHFTGCSIGLCKDGLSINLCNMSERTGCSLQLSTDICEAM